MPTPPLSRRSVLRAAALATTAIGLPFVHGAHAAGKLSVGFWDHWVPGANNALTKLCKEWAEKEKVDITIDYITSQGDKLMLTGAAEQQARSGHDILGMPTWYPAPKADSLEPVDDIMKQLIAENGAVSAGHEYLGKVKGHWIAVPATVGSLTLPPCSRIDQFKEYVGLDLQKMYPAGAPPDKALADQWNWDFFLTAAEKCHKAGFPFGLPLGQTGDSVNWVGAVFNAYGVELVDAEGNITVKTDKTRQVLEWFKKLVAFCRTTCSPGMIRPTTNG
jgi:ABC-type glycerol-3-phosphate transport system substrate-binding protein